MRPGSDPVPGPRAWRLWKKNRHTCQFCGRVSHKSDRKIQHARDCPRMQE